jgi:hypothetical protein
VRRALRKSGFWPPKTRKPSKRGEYSFGVALRHGRLPRQVALYVGGEPLRMKNEIAGPGWAFRFHLVDIRDLDGELLLASDNPGDNVMQYSRGSAASRMQ